MMKLKFYYYSCSPEYVQKIDPGLYDQIISIISRIPKRPTQSEINADLFWLFTSEGWNYDNVPSGAADGSTDVDDINQSLDDIKKNNNRNLCLTSTTLDTCWHADFAKSFNSKLVQIEAQFGKVEAMFKDFCGFRIAYAERRLDLGIVIVLSDPPAYFAHRKNAISGIASFDNAKNTLTTIGLDCPIWLIGIDE
jgi:hypothetical protein